MRLSACVRTMQTCNPSRPPHRRCPSIRKTRWSAAAAVCTATRSSTPARACARACPFVYSYEAWGHTYVGCMQKVYDVEIDLDMLRAAEAHSAGLRCDPRRPAAAADVPGRDRADLREPGRPRSRLRQPGVLGASGRRADVPRDRPDHGRLSSASTRRRRTIRVTSQARPTSRNERCAERERVDGADPDPVERDAESVQRPVRAATGCRDRRCLEVHLDRGVVRGAHRSPPAAAGAARCAR